MEEILIGYIGDYRVHDSKIKEIESDENILQVSLKSEEDEIVVVKFLGAKSISSNRPEGMILYAICEMKEQSPFRKFVFVNTDEEDDAFLEIIAQDCIIQ